MQTLLSKLSKAYPDLTFTAGDDFYWSPQNNTVYYQQSDAEADTWTLLHEASHGILGHRNFGSDFELLQIELAAWQNAKALAAAYGVHIADEHIEDCLDTYRTWLYKRSLCPTCGLESLQKDVQTYSCLNCGSDWQVSANRLCRPYRAQKRLKSSPKVKTTA